jgi:3D (Asp-Asp-Asp) domain-containing protein
MSRVSRHILFVACSVLVMSVCFVAAAEQGPSRALMRGQTIAVSVTAYCTKGETRSGEQTRRGIVAADPAVLPLGTVIRLSRLKRYNGRYIVEDTGRAIKGNDVDIFVPDCTAAKTFGRQQGRVRIERLAESGK